MAKQYFRVGSMVDAFGYDDADFDCAIETDQPIKAGAPVDNNDVARKSEVDAVPGGDVEGPVASTDSALVLWDGVAGDTIKDSNITSDGDSIDIPTGHGYQVNSTQVVGDQEAAEADLAAVPDCTGGDTIDQAVLESYLGDIRTKMNNLLAKLRSHGLIDT